MKEIICKYRAGTLATLLLCMVSGVYPQSGDRNYVLTKTMLDNTGGVSLDRIDYYDGLGRPVQSVLKKASPGQKDIVTLQEYDNTGRESDRYLPVPATTATGAYAAPAAVKAASNGFYGDAQAYEKPVYEPSPLERVTKKYGPGAAWHTAGKAVETAHMSNTASGALSCAFYLADFSSMLVKLGEYPEGTLFVTQTTDEDGNTTHTFTDKQGQTLLARAMDGTASHDTYYVYDNLGQLRYVLPPACGEIDADTLDAYAYRYDYDGRGNCVWKKLPGCEPVEMRYDRADRMIFSRDGNQRIGNEWIFYLYDALGRQVVTGICPGQAFATFESTVVKATYNGGTALGGYAVTPALTGTIKLMTVNYYDDYSFINTLAAAEQSKMAMVTLSGYDNAYPDNTAPGGKGRLTGARAYRLDDPPEYTVSSFYYDHRGRVVQIHASNHLGGFEDEYFAHTFTGKVRQRRQAHSAPGKTTQTETYYYDYGTPQANPLERLLSVSYGLNGAPAVTLAEYSYDEAGRLLTKKLATETSTYHYNVRGWLTQISGTKFSQTMTYNAPVNGVTPTKALYGGNISAMKWKSGNDTVRTRGYKFTYDNLGRLTSAIYGEGAGITSNPDRFNEAVTAYDKMGNIQSLVRRGKLNSGYGEIDNLTYTYNGNKLTKVTDAVTTPVTYEGAFHFVDRANVSNEYAYDANGNMTKDLNKNITSITYNSLNLPEVVTYSGGNTITYVYDGAGRKLSVTYTDPVDNIVAEKEYAGNKVYHNGSLSLLLTEEGYVTPGATPTYHYYLKDHQGNNRVVVNQGGTVRQVNHYYPFGGLFGEGENPTIQSYKYNGKELDRELGLDIYDYGARHYDAALGIWTRVDPLSEKYYPISPYVYVANNPINFIDLRGDSLTLKGDRIQETLMAIYNGLENGTNITMNFNNGILDPMSIEYQAKNTNDVFLQDIYEIAINPTMVELSTSNKNTYMINGQEIEEKFNAPYDYDTRNDNPLLQQTSIEMGLPVGKSISGNLGQTLIPGNVSASGKSSKNNNIEVIINGKGYLKHRTVGIAHEFGHVILYMRGLPYGHGQPGVDDFVYGRATIMSKRLGYDF